MPTNANIEDVTLSLPNADLAMLGLFLRSSFNL